MLYLCRKAHLTEIKGGKEDHNIFCNGCRKHIPKYQTCKFQKINGLIFPARQSDKPSLKPEKRSKEDRREYMKWHMRMIRETPEGRERLNANMRAYRARKKAKSGVSVNGPM